MFAAMDKQHPNWGKTVCFIYGIESMMSWKIHK